MFPNAKGSELFSVLASLDPVSQAAGTASTGWVTAKDSAKLVSASSAAADVVEIHEMKMDKDVMKMAALPNGLDLPAGKTVELKPGSYHVMLMDLKAPLAVDSTVPVTLTFQDAKGNKTTQELKLPVKAMAAPSEHKH